MFFFYILGGMGDCSVDSGSCADNVFLFSSPNFMKYRSFFHCKYSANQIILPSVQCTHCSGVLGKREIYGKHDTIS